MKIINKYKCCLLFGASKSKYLNGLHLVYVLLMLPIFGLFKYLCNYVPLNRVGFFCNDQSIMLPMRPDTVPSIMLFVVIAAFVITVVWNLTHFYNYLNYLDSFGWIVTISSCQLRKTWQINQSKYFLSKNTSNYLFHHCLYW
jgi:hypothetical protein